jgi:hypothetical protein
LKHFDIATPRQASGVANSLGSLVFSGCASTRPSVPAAIGAIRLATAMSSTR